MVRSVASMSVATLEGIPFPPVDDANHPPCLLVPAIERLIEGGRHAEAFLLSDHARRPYEATDMFITTPGIVDLAKPGVLFVSLLARAAPQDGLRDRTGTLIQQAAWYDEGTLHVRSRVESELRVIGELTSVCAERAVAGLRPHLDDRSVEDCLGKARGDELLDRLHEGYSHFLTHMPLLAGVAATLAPHGRLEAWYDTAPPSLCRECVGPRALCSRCVRLSLTPLAHEVAALVSRFLGDLPDGALDGATEVVIAPHGVLRQVPVSLGVPRGIPAWVVPALCLLPKASYRPAFDGPAGTGARVLYYDAHHPELAPSAALAARFDRAHPLASAPGEDPDFLADLCTADVVHVSAHGRARSDLGAGIGGRTLAFAPVHFQSQMVPSCARLVSFVTCWSAAVSGDLLLFDSYLQSFPGLLILSGVEAFVGCHGLVDEVPARAYEGALHAALGGDVAAAHRAGLDAAERSGPGSSTGIELFGTGRLAHAAPAPLAWIEEGWLE